ncbi:MAG: hypothetical protein ACWGO1_04295, partial [Anaerolineales bacterium]
SSIAHRNAMHAVYEVYIHDEETGDWYKRGEEEPEEQGEGVLEDIKETVDANVEKIKKTLL